MPTYEFRLPDGTIIERKFKISEVPAEIPAPDGEGTAVRIISGGAALLFKGSGFYLTDYGRNAHRTQGDAPKQADATASSGESKGEPKGEPKGEAKSKADTAGSTSSSSSGSPSSSSGGEGKPAPAPKSEPKASGSGPAAP